MIPEEVVLLHLDEFAGVMELEWTKPFRAISEDIYRGVANTALADGILESYSRSR